MFSAEQNTLLVQQEGNGYMKTAKQLLCALFAIIGLLCVLFPIRITRGLPYVLGGAMAAAGVVYSVSYFRSRPSGHSAELASGLVLLLVGISCVLHGADSIVPLGTVWAVIGIQKASKSLAAAIERTNEGSARIFSFLGFLIRLTFSMVLLFYPEEKIQTHVVLLGLELMIVSIRLTRKYFPDLDTGE